ncbi:MAG: hypothetical protein NC453_19315 [Muribaculum sp.]|nr:hypothetical protein [Muribaculum sp.]
MNYNKIYGNDNPPYTLYQGEDGLWGLVDKDCVKLAAVFKRDESETFSAIPENLAKPVS